MPIQDAWFNAYGKLMRQGAVPYRDFYCFIQPIPLIISRALAAFGDHLWVFRAYGVMERIALAVALYALYARRFSPAASACAAFGSLMFYQGFRFDLFFHYYQTSLLFFVLALLFALKTREGGHWATPWIAGIAASCSFFSKQSSGAFAVLGVGLVLALQTWNGVERRRALGLYALGGILTILPFLTWLTCIGALPSYFSEIFGRGISAKGTVGSILLDFPRREWRAWYGLPLAFIALETMRTTVLKRVHARWILDPLPPRPGSQAPWFLMALFALITPCLFPTCFHHLSLDYGLAAILPWWLHSTFWAAILCGSWAAVQRFRGRPFSDAHAILLASLFWMYGSAISYELLPEFTIPAFGLAIAFLMDGVLVHCSNGKKARLMPAGAFLAVAISLVVTSERYTISYWWWDWVGGATADAKVESSIPFLHGIKLDPHTAAMYERVTSDIRARTGPNDPILAWPFMPIFNLMADRPFATFAPVGFMDVCPDAIAQADAARVSAERPKIIITMDLGEEAYKRLEHDNRAGRPSGQRDMEALLKNLVDSGAYRVIEEYPPLDDPVSSRNLRPIRVLARVE